jgi:hypothetical protein
MNGQSAATIRVPLPAGNRAELLGPTAGSSTVTAGSASSSGWVVDPSTGQLVQIPLSGGTNYTWTTPGQLQFTGWSTFQVGTGLDVMTSVGGNNSLIGGLVFFKMKNRLVDNGPLNKNFRQPPERNPMEELLEELKEKAERVNDLFDVTMEAIKSLGRGGFVSVPVMIGPVLL